MYILGGSINVIKLPRSEDQLVFEVLAWPHLNTSHSSLHFVFRGSSKVYPCTITNEKLEIKRKYANFEIVLYYKECYKYDKYCFLVHLYRQRFHDRAMVVMQNA